MSEALTATAKCWGGGMGGGESDTGRESLHCVCSNGCHDNVMGCAAELATPQLVGRDLRLQFRDFGRSLRDSYHTSIVGTALICSSRNN